VPIIDLKFFITGLILQRQTGANMVAVLEGLASLVRERLNMAAKLKAHTAQQRFSAGLLCLMPIVVGLGFWVLKPEYIKLLEDIGTDVVELTGDHFIDQGPEATLFTLDLYKQHHWLYYGGGANIEEARQPITLTDHGNKIAFIGCNAKRGGYATASETYPGAAPCDLDYMRAQITKLKIEGYLVIATFQHQEYYTYQVKPDYRPDFTSMAEAGAVIIQGSQAHQPQNLEFDAGELIHYGLGNLFFDQYNYLPETNDAFIDRHVFYDGKYLGTELLTYVIENYARPRPMTPAERTCSSATSSPPEAGKYIYSNELSC
jgi:hypothetical protein